MHYANMPLELTTLRSTFMSKQRFLTRVETMRLHFGRKAYYISRGDLYLHRDGRWRRSIELKGGRHTGLFETLSEARDIVKKFA